MALCRRGDVRPGRLGLPRSRDEDEAVAAGQRHASTASTPRSGRGTSRRGRRGRRRGCAAGTVNINEAYAAAWGATRAPMGGMKAVRARPPARRRGHPEVHRVRRPSRCSGCSASLPPPSRVLGRAWARGLHRSRCARSSGRACGTAGRPTSTTTSWSSAPGFGGSVTALRLTEKGYRVGVLEAGPPLRRRRVRRGRRGTCGATCGRPRLGLLRHPADPPAAGRHVLAGAGVGGGSLVYANTLYVPHDGVLRRPAVARHHRLAGRAGARTTTRPRRMLGVATNPTHDAVRRGR